MKRLASIFLTTLLFFSCEETELSGIEGTWQLVEVLADPGDGSGTFQPVASNEKLQFFSNGTFISSEDLCFSDSESEPSSGVYELESGVLFINGCFLWGEAAHYNFSITEEDELIVAFPCIEPCANKYKRTLTLVSDL